MKIRSIQQMFRTAGLTLSRFPVTILAAAGGSVIGIMIPRFSQSANESRLWLLLMMFAIAIPVSFALTTFAERRKLAPSWRILSVLFVVVLSLLFYFTGQYHTPERQQMQFLLLNTAAILLASFSPFIGKGSINGFWHYNISLLLRFLVTTFFSLVLYLGIVVAIFALNRLFGMHIDLFEELWFFTIGLFHTWFFLSGISDDYQQYDRMTDYPRGLKIFTQYVLLPLLSIYLLILYAYLCKVIISWHFPEAWMLNLVLGFSISGIVALLLIYPLQTISDNRWIQRIGRWFFLSLLPPVALLLLSILRRIRDYGFTENRYFVLVVSLWLACLALFFVLRKFRNIPIIPMSLCLIAVLAGIGPWSAFSVSEKSQQKRLGNILRSHNLLQDGKVTRLGKQLPEQDREQITSIVDYLAVNHGAGSLQPLFVTPLDSMAVAMHNDNEAEAVAGCAHQLMGIPYVKQRERSFRDQDGFLNIRFEPSQQPAIPVSGFDYSLPLRMERGNIDTTQKKTEALKIFPAGDDTFHVWLGANGRIGLNSVQSRHVVFDLKPLVDRISQLKNRQQTDELLRIKQGNERYECLLVVSRLIVKEKDHELVVHELDAALLIKRKETIRE